MQDGDKIITVYFKDILKLKNLTIFSQHYNSDDFIDIFKVWKGKILWGTCSVTSICIVK